MAREGEGKPEGDEEPENDSETESEPEAEAEDDREGERLFGGDPEAPVEGEAFPAF